MIKFTCLKIGIIAFSCLTVSVVFSMDTEDHTPLLSINDTDQDNNPAHVAHFKKAQEELDELHEICAGILAGKNIHDITWVEDYLIHAGGTFLTLWSYSIPGKQLENPLVKKLFMQESYDAAPLFAELVALYGWIDRSRFDSDASVGAAYIAKCLPPEYVTVQQKIVDQMKDTLYRHQDNSFTLRAYANLVDTMQYRKGLPLIYGHLGTFIPMDKGQIFKQFVAHGFINRVGSFKPFPIAQPEEVDQRRKQLGIETLEEAILKVEKWAQTFYKK